MKIVLLDMDEVISDFIGGACFVHRYSRREMEAARKPGTWDISKPMGFQTQTEFWSPINKMGEAFWERLQPLPWYKELIRLVEKDFQEWYIVTSPGYERHPGCFSGKIKWIKKHLPKDYCRKVIMTEHKHLFSKKDVLLIDDREENLINFEFSDRRATEPRGGMGVVFPSTGNCLYKMANNPLPYIEEQLRVFNLQKRKRRVSPLDEVICSSL